MLSRLVSASALLFGAVYSQCNYYYDGDVIWAVDRCNTYKTSTTDENEYSAMYKCKNDGTLDLNTYASCTDCNCDKTSEEIEETSYSYYECSADTNCASTLYTRTRFRGSGCTNEVYQASEAYVDVCVYDSDDDVSQTINCNNENVVRTEYSGTNCKDETDTTTYVADECQESVSGLFSFTVRCSACRSSALLALFFAALAAAFHL